LDDAAERDRPTWPPEREQDDPLLHDLDEDRDRDADPDGEMLTESVAAVAALGGRDPS
jgi:hypothetical protein